jgi:pyruvate kinase
MTALRHDLVKSKIICTIGPASSSEKILVRMIEGEMDVARINFSHGTRDENGRVIKRIKDSGGEIAIMCDIQGPRIRVGRMSENIVFERGDSVLLTSRDIIGDNERIPISYKRLSKNIKKGDKVFLNDGIIGLEVLDVASQELSCRVLSGGLLTSNKGVNFPDIQLSKSVPTKKDILDLEFIAGLDVEYVAVSFVENKREIDRVRKVLDNKGSMDVKLVSKIEREAALKNFEEILDASDGIMVARGDLGVETSPERVPLFQKKIIRQCNREGKPVIVATQMLESMIFQSIPTRAEASDVFNAVLDGADALMLSGETSIGKYPVKALSIMAKIAASAETVMPRRDPSYYDAKIQTVAEVLGQAVHTIVSEFEEHGTVSHLFILTITRGGYSARMISKYRPPVPIFAATHSRKVLRQLNLLWGVKPTLFESDPSDSTDDVIKKAVKKALMDGHLTKMDFVIIVCASSLVKRKTNILGIFRVNEIINNV